MPITIKTFTVAVPDTLLNVPDSSELDAQMNAFLSPLDPNDVLEVYTSVAPLGKYGTNTILLGTVVYKV